MLLLLCTLCVWTTGCEGWSQSLDEIMTMMTTMAGSNHPVLVQHMTREASRPGLETQDWGWRGEYLESMTRMRKRLRKKSRLFSRPTQTHRTRTWIRVEEGKKMQFSLLLLLTLTGSQIHRDTQQTRPSLCLHPRSRSFALLQLRSDSHVLPSLTACTCDTRAGDTRLTHLCPYTSI